MNDKSEEEWYSAQRNPPREGRRVMTKIDDDHGVRNEQILFRNGNLWFFPDSSMYVYYRPTHWKPLDREER